MSVLERSNGRRLWLALLAALALVMGTLPPSAHAAGDTISGEIVLPTDFDIDEYSWIEFYLYLERWDDDEGYWDDSHDLYFDDDDVVEGKIPFEFPQNLSPDGEYRLQLSVYGAPLLGGYYVDDASSLALAGEEAATISARDTLVLLVDKPVAITGTVTLPEGESADWSGIDITAVHAATGREMGYSTLRTTATDGVYSFNLNRVKSGEDYYLHFEDRDRNYVSGYATSEPGVFTYDRSAAAVVSAPSSGVALTAAPGLWIEGSVTLPVDVETDSIRVEALLEVDEGWEFVSSAYVDTDGSFAIGGLPAGAYAVYLDDSRNQIVDGYYVENGSPLSSEPVALVAAGTTGLVLSAAESVRITGTVVVPSGVDLDDFEVTVYEYDEDWGWWDTAWSRANRTTGRFSVGGLEEGREYRVQLWAWSGTGYVGGFYDGPGAPLVGSVDKATSVIAPASGIDLVPAVGDEISGTVLLPPGFSWDVDGWDEGFSMYASEVGGSGRDASTYVSPESNGQFTIKGLRPGSSYVLEVYDYEGRFASGYYHAGADGLVELSLATPVTAGTTGLSIKVAAMTVSPVLRALVSPLVSGPAVVGSTLSVTAGQWSMTDVGVSYQWLRDGAVVPGATSSTYPVTAADVGKRLSVMVTGFRSGFAPVAVQTASTAVVAYPAIISTGRPTIAGTAKVGEQLVATAGSWGQAGVATAFQWLRDGSPITGATAARYTLTVADLGARIAVRVTVTKAGFAPSAETSAATTVVGKGKAPKASKVPTFAGTVRFGATLTAKPGSWDTSGAQFVYQWLRAGKAIKGATKAKYQVKKADVGKKLSVRVTAKVAGHDDGAAVSKVSKKVAKAKPKVTAKAKTVNANKRPSVAVTVTVAGLAKPTGTVTVTYGKRTVKAKLGAKRKGKVSVRLPVLAKGTHAIKVTYTPNKKSKKVVTKATSKQIKLRVR